MFARLRRAHDSWAAALPLLALLLVLDLTGHGALGSLLVLVDLLLFGTPGFLQPARRRQDAAPEEAWDNGFQHGVRTAHAAAAAVRKPYITLGQEQGWDLARRQLLAPLEELVDADEVAR